LGGLLYALTVNRLVVALGRARLSFSGALLLSTAFLLLAAAPHWALDGPALALAGLGFYMFHNTLQTEATQMIPEARGIAVALFALSLFLGQATGVGLFGFIFDRLGGPPIFLASALLLPVIAIRFRRGLG
jgi:YNFM family putative membrane transporter